MLGALAIKYTFGHPELGQTPETGFDCSGFVRYVLLKSGLVVPDYLDLESKQNPIRHVNEFWDYYGVFIHPELQRPGDLIFFSGNGYFPQHVGIVNSPDTYIHKGDSQIVESQIVEEELNADPRTTDLRLTFTKNPIGYKSPTITLPSVNYRYNKKSI